MAQAELTSGEIDLVSAFMHDACGIALEEKGSLISTKMSMLCSRLGYRHFYELWDEAQGATIASAGLRQQIIDSLTTSYSYFFREDVHFARLGRLIEEGQLPCGKSELRVWSAGCASGEEAYNLAMQLEDELRAGYLPQGYHIVASDISSKAIEASTAARYDISDVARMPSQWTSRYCMRSGQGYEINKVLRNRIDFRLESILSPRPDAPFDVVMCRNTMIYFGKDSIDRFCRLLRGKVKPGGYLFLGHAELMSNLPGFTYIEPSIWRHDVSEGLLL